MEHAYVDFSSQWQMIFWTDFVLKLTTSDPNAQYKSTTFPVE